MNISEKTERELLGVAAEGAGAEFDSKWYRERYADVAATGQDPAEHYVSHGQAEGRFRNAGEAVRAAMQAGIEPTWYISRYPDVAAAGQDPAEHYALYGRHEGRFPNAKAAAQFAAENGVNPAWYANTYTDVVAANFEPEEHYGLYGHAEGRIPNPYAALQSPLRQEVDCKWYVERYADVAETGADPAEHYVVHGHVTGYFPNAGAEEFYIFNLRRAYMAQVDPAWYLANYADVAAAGVDPAEHFALHGQAQGRFPNAEAAARHAKETHSDLYEQVDPIWYLANYPDVVAAGADPRTHFALSGHAEGRFPNAEAAARHAKETHSDLYEQVDPIWYLANYPDVVAAGADPRTHFALSGHAEGRFPNAEAAKRDMLRREVDPDWYIAYYPDIAACGLEPQEHYILYGRAEGRLPNPTRLPAEAWQPSIVDTPTSKPLSRYPLIGVVTPARNRQAWTIGFARMLDNQDYPFFRLYVVDSNSTDGTPEALRALGLSSLVVLHAPDSAYWTAATNIGVEQALNDGCEYILTINDDAIIPPDFLTTIVRSAESAAARIVGSVISFADVPGRLWGVGAYNDWSTGSFVQLAMASAWDTALTQVPRSQEGLIPADYLCGNGTLVHRSVFHEIGLYDVKNTPHYHADSELTMRAERFRIDRWICSDARLYNRFSESDEGIFAKRNQRLFSFRSANYARALLFIIDRYCPQDLKARALVQYFLRHVRQPGMRTWSRLLRVVQILDMPLHARHIRYRDFFPPRQASLCLEQDLEILLGLSHDAFMAMLYPVLLRRRETDAERAVITRALELGYARQDLVREVLSRLEAKYSWSDQSLQSDDRGSQYSIKPFLSSDGITEGKTTVYMNIDVLCMAVTDPRAATGVHRYVSNILAELMRDPRVNLQLFHAEELAASAAKLRAQSLADCSFAPADQHFNKGVVFYPYFPFSGKDPRFAAIPHVITLCDLFPLSHPEWFSAVAISKFRRQLRDLTGVSHVLCISSATQAALQTTFPTLNASSSVAYLGVKLDRLRRAASEDRFTGQLGRPYFVCVGTIEPRKNLRSVIAAMRHLSPQVRELQMVVVGQVGWSITSQELVALAGEERSRIHFLGHVPDAQLWDLYANAICTVFPSLAEGFGFPIVESFSCGTPVVTSDRSSMAEIAGDGALLVNPLDPAAIAMAVESLASDVTLRSVLAKHALERARLFTWKSCAERHVEVFEQLAAHYMNSRECRDIQSQ
jgi:glycosyltransferase involved in cell wall biosynthesis/GT2 family glycosyltransferase